MTRRHPRAAAPLGGFAAVVLVAFSLGWSVPLAALTLTSAVSRLTHGSAGSFDVQLPLTGGSGIECRSVTNGMTLVMTFDQPLTGGTAAVTAGTATLGAVTRSTNTMTVKLTGVANAQAVTVTLSNLTDGVGGSIPSINVPFRVLLGDCNADAQVAAGDVFIVKARSSQTTNGANFRSDFNLDGQVAAGDVFMVKAASSTSVTGGPTANTAPSITAVANQSGISGQATTPVSVTVGDAESNPATLAVIATSSDQVTVPDSSIVVSGTGAARSITITPPAGLATTTPVTITLMSSDGILTSTPATFTLTVSPAPTVYLATLQPLPGVSSLGSGTATLSVSGDQTYAILRYTVSNLAGADSDDAIYAPGDAVLYDIPVGKTRGDLQPDGSIKWTFGTGATAALAAIQSNTAYITIESAAFPAGELRGTFQKVVGSGTFIPPDPPPSITINPPTPFDASRLLQQAAFGGMQTEVAALSNTAAPNANTAIDDWLTQQFATTQPISPSYGAASPTYTPSSAYKYIYDRITTPQGTNPYGDALNDDRMHEAWWHAAVTGNDQLRQRVATALSEIFVVSEIDDTIDGNIPGLASYYDMLANDAFGNFRTLLEDVTLHPIMGDYLNMRGNVKASAGNGNAAPNENYAREVMQLFSIGLYMLQPDGSLMLDANGQPIPTYDQTTISNFAQVFTGWNVNGTAVVIPVLVSNGATPPAGVVQNFNSSYQKPMVVNANNHSALQKNLLVYPGSNSVIAANSSQTATTATAELEFALDNIFNHPNVGPFICRQLIKRLVCSNPSPGYVYRVSQAFNNDGTGVRGNLKAVIGAILTDYEARSPNVLSSPGFGKAREPLVRMATLVRSLNGKSMSGKWAVGKTDNALAQTIFRSPTVFNFFDPSYTAPGGIQQAGLVSPEFDIIYETTIINAQNMVYTGVYATYNTDGSPKATGGGTGFKGDAYGTDIYLDFSPTGNGLAAYAQANGIPALIDRVGLIVMGCGPQGGPNQMDPAMRSRIQQFAQTLSATDYVGQAKAVVHLVSTSAIGATQK